MTVKEISALRKSGNLDEALQAAKKEFSLNSNNFTASALFWCLNDLCKKESIREEIASLYEQMKSLYEKYCENDELMPKFLKTIEQRLDPVSIEIKKAIETAKAGSLTEETIKKFQEIHNSGELNHDLYPIFGWLIYYNLKNTPLNNSLKRKQLLHSYLKLELPRPELLHSLILSEAVKVEKNTPFQFRIRDFMKIWGWENLRTDDWNQYTAENGVTVAGSSLVEKLISVYAKEIKTDNVQSPEEFDILVDKALAKYPNNQYMPFYKATVLKSFGKNEEALQYYKELILKSPSKYYLWNQASELVEDKTIQIALLCKAVTVEKDESFIGSCRLNLANALVGRELFSNAKYELEKYHDFYTSKNWGLKQEYRDVESKIPSGTVSKDNKSLYDEYIPMAEEFIYSALPSILAIKVADRQLDDRNRPGRKFTQWTLRTENGSLNLRKPSKFGLNNRTTNGTIFEVRLNDGKVVWIKNSSADILHLDWIKKTVGSVKLRTDRNGKSYALLDGTYIGEKLLINIKDGQKVQITAIRQDDSRWSAVSLTKI